MINPLFFEGHLPVSYPIQSKEMRAKVEKRRQELMDGVRQALKNHKSSLKQKSILNRADAQLDKLVELMDKGVIDSSRALVLMHLGHSAIESGYEGWNVKSAADLYGALFDIIKNNGVFANHTVLPESVQEAIGHLQENNCAGNEVKMAETIEQLAEGKSYTMSGGWKKMPHGHAMVYRFKKCAGETFNIYIYHAPSGIEEIHGGELKLGRKRAHPCMVFKGVTWEELFFCKPGGSVNPILFERLHEYSEHAARREGSLQAVLDCFFHIQHRLISSKEVARANHFISMQQSGKCVIKSINCLLLDLINDLPIYKKTGLDTRFFTLLAAYRSFKNSHNLSRDQKLLTLFQLKEAAASYLTLLDTNFLKQKLNIAEEHYEIACATIQEMKEALEAMEETLISTHHPQLPSGGTYLSDVEGRIAQERLNQMAGLPDMLKAKREDKEVKDTPAFNPQLGKNASWKDFESVLKTLNEYSRDKGIEYQNCAFQFESTLRNLSQLKRTQPSDSLDVATCETLLQTLLDLQNRYNEAVDKIEDYSSPAVQNTAMEFLALAYRLSVGIDRGKGFGILENFDLDINYFLEAARNDPLFSSQEGELLKQRNTLEHFFLKYQQPSIWNLTNREMSENLFLEGNTAEGALYKAYIEKSTAVEQEMRELAENESRGHPYLHYPLYGALHCFKKYRRTKKITTLKHLHQLRESAILAAEMCVGGKDTNHWTNDKWKVDSSYIYFSTKRNKWSTSTLHKRVYNAYDRDFSPKGELKGYTKNAQSSHESSKLQPENALIVQHDIEKPAPEFAFYLGLAEPEVQTTLLLHAAEEHLERLAEPHFRLQLLHMFVKNIEKGEEWVSPFILFCRDPHNIRKFERFVKLGKKSFVDTMPETKPLLEEMLFTIRLYARALHTLRALHPTLTYSKETLHLIGELETFLNKAEACVSNFSHPEELKKEIRMARVGLFLAAPLSTMSSEKQARCFVEFLRFKNEFPSKALSSDPSFVRSCKTKFFHLDAEWQSVFKEQGRDSAFANACLNQLLGRKDLSFQWRWENQKLVALEERWTIDLAAPSIHNDQGSIFEAHRELHATPSLKRLFKDPRYHLKIFGAGKKSEVVYFTSPVWGDIKIEGKDQEWVIHRKIDNKWFTYIPHAVDYVKKLHLNDALVGDHALWMDMNTPHDLRICDLETGEQVCHTESDGRVYHDKTKKVFYQVADAQPTLMNRFEGVGHISGWLEKARITEQQDCGSVTFDRFRSAEENQPLSFKWDRQKRVWMYVQNPLFHLDTGPDIALPFQTNHFFHLVNGDGTKRKMLIPLAPVSSSGYSPQAAIDLPLTSKDNLSLDQQKGSLRYFEYTVTNKDQLVPHSLEGRVYLAHLYLAQKRYREAADLIRTISISEKLSTPVVAAIQNLWLSSEPVHDYSPNACALHLLLYYIAYKIDPFLKIEKTIHYKRVDEYKLYSGNVHHVESPLRFTREQEVELIAFLHEGSGYSPFMERQCFFKQGLLPSQVYSTSIQGKKSEKITVVPKVDFKSEGNCTSKWQYYQYINSNSLGSDLFKKYYRQLQQSTSLEAPEVQGVLYELLLGQLDGYKNFALTSTRVETLFLVACFPKKVPNLPLFDLEDDVIEWYEKLKRVPEELNGASSTHAFSLPVSHGSPAEYEKIPPPLVKPLLTVHDSLPLLQEGQDARFRKWQVAYLCERGKTPAPKKESRGKKPNKVETLYEKAMEQHREHYEKDCAIAHEKHQKREIFKPALKEGEYRTLIEEMKKEGERAQKNEELLLKKIKKLATRPPTDTLLHFTRERAALISQRRRDPTLETLLRAASQPNGVAALIGVNPHLSVEESQELQCMCIELMIETTHRSHLERVYEPLGKWLIGGQETYFNQAQDALVEHRHYDPTRQFFPLLFEYLSELRVREKQAHIVNDVLTAVFRNGESQCFQLIMAGGKTSVIISLLAELISESGSVPCILTHPSQFASIKGNLKAFQSRRFGKDLYILDYSLEDLSDVNTLSFIVDRMKEAKRKKSPLLMKTSFPQILELKFILESLRLPYITDVKEAEALRRKIETLSQLNLFLRTECVGIYDECDLNLSMLTDVHIPQGRRENIAPERAAVVKAIYETLLDPKVKDLMGWTSNCQAELSSEDLEHTIMPFLAEKVFDHSTFLLSNKTEFKEAFVRYVTNKIEPEDQKVADRIGKGEKIELSPLSLERQQNIAFLCELEKRHHSDDRYVKESCQLIALAKRMVCKVLKVALSRRYNRNYGHDEAHDDGRVIPYVHVKTQATTQFGDIYLALAYQFQAALNAPLSRGQIKFLAEKMYKAALFHAAHEKRNFLEIAEAKQFEEMTKVSLVEIQTQEGLEKAYQWVNDPEHLERRLELVAEIAPFHVCYYKKKASSNSINNVQQFKRRIACSATLWNRQTYHHDLPFNLDEGTEGSILNVMSERAEEYATQGKTYIHEVADFELPNLCKLLREHPDKKKLRALLDGGGLLLGNYTNEGLAVALKNFFIEEKQKGGPEIKAIVYLHKFSPEEVKRGSPKESFALLKLDSEENHPILLKNTTREEIEEHDLKKEDLFFIFDEARATGTDIELADDALFLMTCDHKMPIRTGLQSPLRARKFFLAQRVEFVVTTKGRKEMVGGGKTFADLRQTWENNEAILLKNQKDSSRPAQLENQARNFLITDLLQKGPRHADFNKNVLAFEKYLISSFEEEIYENEKIVGTDRVHHVLDTYASNLFDKYKNVIRPQVRADIERVLQAIKEEIPDDEVMPLCSHERIEMEIQQELELQLELELLDHTQEIEINRELLQEWQSYNFIEKSGPSQEKAWGKLDPKAPLLPQIQNRLLPIAATLARTEFGGQTLSEKVKEYARGFPDTLQMTQNFYQTHMSSLPLLHAHTKEVKFILWIEAQLAPVSIFLSEKDAAFFKQWISQYRPSGVHLIDSRGFPETNSEQFYKQQPTIQTGVLKTLCYANLFNGNSAFLDEQATVAKQLFKEHHNALASFMVMKVLSSKGRGALHKIAHSKVFDFSKTQLPQPAQQGIVFSSRRMLIAKKYRQIRSLGPDHIRDLDPEDVPDIAGSQVPWLVTREQVAQVRDNLINHLDPKQIQQGLLPPQKISILRKAELIQALHRPEDLLKLSEQQVKQLSDGQMALLTQDHLPFLDFIEEERFKKITHIDLLLAMPQRCTGWIAPAQQKLIEGALDNRDNVQKMREPLFKKLIADHPELIKKLSEIQVKRLETQEQLNQLEENQIPWISTAQINTLVRSPEMVAKLERVSPEKIAHLHPDAVPHLQDTSLPHLTTKEQLRALPPAKHILLNKTQAKILGINPQTNITRIVLSILAALVGIGAVLSGCLALTGFVIIPHYASYTLIAGGGVLLLTLAAYATYLCCRNRTPNS